jgi:hypothetical protein
MAEHYQHGSRMPSPNVYEVSPDESAEKALDCVIDDIRAASHLGIAFTVTTVHSKQFRGGNVSKASVIEYRVEFGKPVVLDG